MGNGPSGTEPLRIVVTGGAGRLGRSVVAGLRAAGHAVLSADRESGGGEPSVAVDLLDPEAARRTFADFGADAVIHLAAIAVPFSAPERTIWTTNTALAFTVLEAAVQAEVGRVVVASSPTVYGYNAPGGWVPERFPLDEDVPPRPWNAYAASKLAHEQLVATFARQHGDRVRFAAFRPCYVIAPEEWAGALTQQGHTVRARLDDPALSAAALFNYVDARDVADFLDRLLERLPVITNGETFLVGAEDALAREPLAELLPRFHPGTAAVAAGLTGTAPAFTSAKAARLLGWRPTRRWRTELVDHDHRAGGRGPGDHDLQVPAGGAAR